MARVAFNNILYGWFSVLMTGKTFYFARRRFIDRNDTVPLFIRL